MACNVCYVIIKSALIQASRGIRKIKGNIGVVKGGNVK